MRHAVSLTITFFLCWVYAWLQGALLGRLATQAMLEADFSGLGAARFDYHVFMLMTPLVGATVYGLCRAAVWLTDIARGRLRPAVPDAV